MSYSFLYYILRILNINCYPLFSGSLEINFFTKIGGLIRLFFKKLTLKHFFPDDIQNIETKEVNREIS